MSHVVLSSRARLIYEWIQNTLSPCGRGQGEGCEVVSPRNPLPLAGEGGYEGLPLRQQTLADQFQCSRRTIGRCLAELKAAGLLADTGKRENRVKVYAIDQEKSPPFGKGRLGGILPETDRLSGIKIPPDPPFSKGGDSSSSMARYITLEPFYSQEFPPIRLMPGETLNPKAADQWRFYYKNIRLNLWCYDGQNGRPKLEDIYASLTQNLDGKDDMEVFKNMFQLLKGAPYYEACLESHERERLSNSKSQFSQNIGFIP